MSMRAMALALALFLVLGVAAAQDKTGDELAKYREMLADGNPAELTELKGEELWKTPRGPNKVSLERCDLGLGPGVVDGAYAELPRYFADTGKVMDVEARLVHCMISLQGMSRQEATRQWFTAPGKEADLEALVTYIGARSNGKPIKVPAKQPQEARMVQIGERIFFRRTGPQDFSCAICHAQDGKRIRLQELGNLTTPAGAATAMQSFPAYRVSQGNVWTMQRRLIDCVRQARWPEPEYLSEMVIALEIFLANKANGTVLQTPGIKR